MYHAGMKPSESHFHDIRGLRYHVRTWGNPDNPLLFLLHGWMDVSASFQFLVDAFDADWYVVAPDWRGFGLTEWAPAGYWFPDYYADLEALLDLYGGGHPAQIAGHSMGGNIALTYSGLRPGRVARIASLEGFGLARAAAKETPARLRRWLDGLRDAPRFREYDSFDALAARLERDNPRLDTEKARFLARHWAASAPDGSVRMQSDPRHKLPNPYPWRIDETIAAWREVTAPVLWVYARDSKRAGYLADTPAELAERRGAFTNLRETTIEDCGHMMHLDQPRELAARLEAFLERPSPVCAEHKKTAPPNGPVL